MMETMKKVPMIRQGDLLLIPQPEVDQYIERDFGDGAEIQKDGVVAKGETSGHHHRIDDIEAAVVLYGETRQHAFIRVGPNGVALVHEEHGPIQLEPNTTYKVFRAREYSYLNEMARRVRD